MQTSSQPKLLPVPFANGGAKQDIPNDSQVGITAGRASYTDGFPPLTRTPLAAGGIPPFGTDFNGVLNDITAAVRWAQAGGGYPFDATFNTEIAGFPKGAKIPNSTLDGFWLNTTDGNSVNPENTNGSLTGWVPAGNYGTTAITGLSGSSITLTALQAAKSRITLAGALTANISITVPAWKKSWVVVNNCTGSFNVTVKTPSGTGVSIPTGYSASIIGDGTNITQEPSPLGSVGRLIGPPQTFASSGTYIPTPGTKQIFVELVGGGGAGAGAIATTSTQITGGAGGGAGGYASSLITSVPSSVVVTVGTGGVGAQSDGGGAAPGGTTSFGSLLQATGGGGGGGTGNSPVTSGGTPAQSRGGDGGIGTGGNIMNAKGGFGDKCLFTVTSSSLSGGGGSSRFSGGPRSTSGGGVSAPGTDAILGAGGSAAQSTGGGAAQKGGNGGNGFVIVWEYS